MPLDKSFNFEKVNVLCDGFVRLGCYSNLLNKSKPFEVLKGSGRKWTKERVLNQLMQCRKESFDDTQRLDDSLQESRAEIEHQPDMQ